MTADLESDVEQDDPRFAALERLRASRVQLQAVLIPQRRSPGATGRIAGDLNDWSKTARTLWRFIRSRNAAGLLHTVGSFIGQWWTRHPLQPTVSLIGQAVDTEVGPWVRKNPISAIALGICGGAAIAWIRPWRWHALHAQARSLQRYASHWLVSELTSPTMQMLIATSIAAWLSQRNEKPSTAPESPGETVRQEAPAA